MTEQKIQNPVAILTMFAPWFKSPLLGWRLTAQRGAVGIADSDCHERAALE